MNVVSYICYEKWLKLILLVYFISTSQLTPQTYLNLSYNNGDPSNSTDLSIIQKITFSSTDITFLLTDNSSVSKAFSIIDNMAFSPTNGSNPLPVELVSFTAKVKGKTVTIFWITETEVDNYGFDIERKLQRTAKENENWLKLGFVEGHGNSNSPKEYSFADDNPPSGTILYRLKQIDTDGSFAYSDVVSVNVGIPDNYVLKQNYPNPFNPTTNIVYYLPVDGFITLKIYDVIGNEVAKLVNENKKAGRYVVTFNGSNLSSGVYFCRITSGNYFAIIKMILIK
ncbi:T9SS type A sorting domain-containing protein [bacterium BMS3Abin03]|nr:T9SS type A sorting domain-containing protein [bacterium BMS3Abin03]